MHKIRWWLFKALTRLVWAVCPKDIRDDMQSRLSFDMTDPDADFVKHLNDAGWLKAYKSDVDT